MILNPECILFISIIIELLSDILFGSYSENYTNDTYTSYPPYSYEQTVELNHIEDKEFGQIAYSRILYIKTNFYNFNILNNLLIISQYKQVPI